MADINELIRYMMMGQQAGGPQSNMGGGMMGGMMGGAMPPNQTSGMAPQFIAQPTYAIGSGAGQGAMGGTSAGGKGGMGMMDKVGAGAGLLNQTGLLPKPVSKGISGAQTGATLGSFGGPIGTGIGAGVGGLAGLLGGKGGGGPNPRAGNIGVSQIPLGGF
jgi:hypothetical protein